jgi:2-polyprenyl-3-methyl-5-hydroxy-6-metoxy-1,4-benzoquinol methylase
MLNAHVEKRFTSQASSKTFQNIIRTYGLDNKSVFDIGCSYGEHLINFGPGSYGITMKTIEVEYGRQKGLKIDLGNIEDQAFELDRKFDVVFANNILEHLYSPHHFLCGIKKYLKEDGIAIIGVPCVPAIRALIGLRKFNGSLSHHHINFYNKFTLGKTVERSGWIIQSVRGFRIYPTIIDHLLDPIYPHFYVVARVDKTFEKAVLI